ncbi:MAG: exodeoxyribonuclease VII small subunit [Proteobacteria bacterium]|nr:exodeoxyribonuclease VII small subunit [Pseudomonadota bacterium]
MKRKTSAVDFEQSLTELEALVERLEHGDAPLEESLKTFERGIALTRDCQSALQTAQQRVELLVKRDGKVQLTEFAASDGADTVDPDLADE